MLIIRNCIIKLRPRPKNCITIITLVTTNAPASFVLAPVASATTTTTTTTTRKQEGIEVVTHRDKVALITSYSHTLILSYSYYLSSLLCPVIFIVVLVFLIAT